MRRGGHVVVGCTVTMEGVLRACHVEDERPPELGFATAALALIPQFTLRPGTRYGQPVEAMVHIPIFWPGDEEPEQPWFLVASATWVAAPTYAQVLAAIPAEARASGMAGHASLTCSFNAEGHIGACRVASEEPAGQGFGEAARGLSQQFQMLQPQLERRNSRQASVVISVTFPAAAAGRSTQLVGQPHWIQLPTRNQALNVYPATALAARTAGDGWVGCSVDDHGALADCTVVGESPTGHGFGQAALSLAQYFRMSVWTDEGLPTAGARIRFPIQFRPGPTPRLAAPAAAP